ncbi:MAG: DUF1295 domain-containing protein, partial [Myxococcota bacterium]
MSIPLASGLALWAFVTLVWLLSVVKKDVSIIDPCWAPLFLLVSVVASTIGGWTAEKLLLTALVGLWALRLGTHLAVRAWGKDEDFRYEAFRRRFGPKRYWWFSYFQVFLLQGALAFIISAPLQLAGSDSGSGTIGVFDIIGAVVFAIG